MTEIDDNIKLKKALKAVEIADKFRLVFQICSLIMVLIVFFGNTFAAKYAWYQAGRSFIYYVSIFVVGVMLISNCVRFYLAARYNRLLENQKESPEE